ncbi:hypothetical protein CVT24_001522 [Panaeolus cyanescens]|uniref:Calcineurin-like phosphoesterase domain-containing protein n=1 Tax=Panaeolus cyanescens TaxID=181874 RepID=A0A409YFD2_9AGAR|nr:hypothetical protein CVT24_001522 [Panaeolus cyanescens]
MGSPTCFKFYRSLRSICTPLIVLVGFTLMLTYVFILYQPNVGPGMQQRMGWQSWTVISIPANKTSATPSQSHTDTTADKSVDWWNVTSPAEPVDSSTLPLDIWSPLLPHDTGLSEIALSRCVLEPAIGGDLCFPDSTPEEDAIKGKWVRVERDLNLEGGYISGYLNIYYRRTRRMDVKLITDIQLLGKDELPNESGNWEKAKTSIHAGLRGIPPMYLWYKLGKTAGEMTADDKANIITELDILYGEDVPWYGFEKLEPPTLHQGKRVEATWITYRRGVKVPPKAPPLHFSKSGKFKIMQVADLHFSVDQGFCKDASISPCEHSDNMTNTLIARVIDQEKPDLIVFTGDQLNGQGTSWDPKSVLAKFARAVTEKGVPWAVVFGNHDEDDGFKKEYQVALMKGLPYSLVERGPKDIHGVGNYVLKVMSADASKTHLLTLYFLDSGSYSKGVLDWFGFFRPTEYDWIKQDQIDWFLQQSASIDPIERPFSPDTGKDFGSIWNRQADGDQLTPNTKKLAKPNALMFFHIPLPETYSKPDRNPITGKTLDVGTSDLETPGNAKHNDGFFQKGVLQALESEHIAKRKVPEVKVIGNGHCHVTENCRRVNGVWFCFGGGGSYSGYGRVGFDRRFRIYDISDFGETIVTYKHTEKDEIVDKMTLSGTNAAPLW